MLLHKRRVNEAQASGDEPVFTCVDCFAAFSPARPSMSKYALANHMWLGRWDPLFRDANLSHQMLLALARVVTTKVVLRPEGRLVNKEGSHSSWDLLFHQSGMIGSAVLFGNGTCKAALERFPPRSVKDAFAVSFVSQLPPPSPTARPDGISRYEGLDAMAQAEQEEARRVVKGIAILRGGLTMRVTESSHGGNRNFGL